MVFGHVVLTCHGIGPWYGIVRLIISMVNLGEYSWLKILLYCKYYFDSEMRDGF